MTKLSRNKSIHRKAKLASQPARTEANKLRKRAKHQKLHPNDK